MKFIIFWLQYFKFNLFLYKMKTTIAFAWWWTWWHIFPIKSLIDNIDNEKYTILWFWWKNSLEEKICKELKYKWKNIIFIPVLSWKIRREISLKNIYFNIIDFFKNIIGFFQSLYYIIRYNPKFVFSKWWFVAFCPALAWKLLFKKVYVHESDTIPGLVNKLVSFFANKTYLWFEYAKKYMKTKKIEVVWQILWNDFYKDYKYPKSERTKLLVMWWSQWAKIIIDAVKTLLDKWEISNFDIYIIWWTKNNDNIFQDYKNVYFFWFLSQDKLIDIYEKVDISITRWSATSLAEQDQFDIKKIIIPLPYTWWNHQYYNALEYEKKWDIFISQLDKNFINKLSWELKKLENYKKQKWTYKKIQDGKIQILKEILN